MKVLHITNAFPYEGHPEFGCFIAEQINSLPDFIESDIVFINAHKNGPLEYVRVIPTILKKIRQCEVVHCHHLFSLIVLRLCYFGKKKVVLSFLNDWTKEIKLPIPEFLKSLICQFYLRTVSSVIFKSFIPKFLTGEKYQYLPNGVDTSFFSSIERENAIESLGLERSNKYILFVSSKNLYRNQKRYDIFEEVIRFLNNKYPEKNYMPITMSVDSRETALLKFNAASLHFLPSDYEGSPNSVKESLSCGTPVVARRAGSVEDLIKDVPYSSVLDTDSIEILSEEINSKLDDNIDKNLVRRAFLKKSLDKDSICKRLINIYKS